MADFCGHKKRESSWILALRTLTPDRLNLDRYVITMTSNQALWVYMCSFADDNGRASKYNIRNEIGNETIPSFGLIREFRYYSKK